MIKFQVALALLLLLALQASLTAASGSSSDCSGASNTAEGSLMCRGSRAIRNMMNNLSKSDAPLVIVRGLEIVPTLDRSIATEAANASTDNPSILGQFSDYLRSHELNVKFADLLEDGGGEALLRDLEHKSGKVGKAGRAEEARKKDKGNGIVMAMALMFAKTMAMLGLGGIGALAMKALGVAMMALLMAALVGVKSLAQHGHESSHSTVQYVPTEGGHHHKRRRRSVGDPRKPDDLGPSMLAYRGWPKTE